MKTTATRLRTRPLQVRITEDELIGFRHAAVVAGISLSAWVRERLRSAARREVKAFVKMPDEK